MLKQFGYVRVACVTPKMKVANTNYNTQEIIKEIDILERDGVNIAVFPELSITGYTCQDLFLQSNLIDKSMDALKTLVEYSLNKELILIVGAPILCDNQLFNTAVVINEGKILGIVPKSYIPNYGEFYEARWFHQASSLISKNIKLFDMVVPIGTDLIFRDRDNASISFGIEICEDLWSPKAPSIEACLNGATMIFNLSASNEIIGKHEYRKSLVKMASAKNVCAYIYTSSSVNESSTDLVFSGEQLIAENGTILKEGERFNFDSSHIIMDVDNQLLINNRLKDMSFMGLRPEKEFRYIEVCLKDKNTNLLREYPKYPFVPKNAETRELRCQEIINIQACGVAKRLLAINGKKCVIGMSGGLDSTLAFLVIIAAYKKLGISNENLIGVTMPGFGTTDRTYNNALFLMKSYGVTIKEVDIKASCLQHFKDIGLDEKDRSVVYENTQARERTQILMDIANKEGGLVIGTGDLSELALGWCTYNGDQMSMYAVNTSIPKTLVRYLVEFYASKETGKAKEALLDILDTPISPELLPPDESGNIEQKTENIVGPYILHDFFLYHFLRYGASPEKIRMIARKTFKNMYQDSEIDKWLDFFIKRFFKQQFKRSCMPDGIKVGTISLSPRGDLRMSSDSDYSIWLK